MGLQTYAYYDLILNTANMVSLNSKMGKTQTQKNDTGWHQKTRIRSSDIKSMQWNWIISLDSAATVIEREEYGTYIRWYLNNRCECEFWNRQLDKLKAFVLIDSGRKIEIFVFFTRALHVLSYQLI